MARLEPARGRINLAEAYFHQALETVPGKGPIPYQLGLLYESSGRREEAMESCRKAYAEGCGLGLCPFPHAGTGRFSFPNTRNT